ncbi:MAG: cytochrome c oxidase assembly protein [Parvibaculaceae bacterium]
MAMLDQGKDFAARNRRTAIACGVVVVSMVGASYAAVPLYRLFCQVTGFGGTTQRAEAAPATSLDRKMAVRFDANVGHGLGWRFEPEQVRLDVRVGETSLAFYRATNLSQKPVTGQAVFNVTPPQAGYYFNKIECFCFTEQTLEPGQSVDMPVQFFVDPAIVEDKDLKNLGTITLSYTFYPAGKPAASSPKVN